MGVESVKAGSAPAMAHRTSAIRLQSMNILRLAEVKTHRFAHEERRFFLKSR